MNRREMFQAVAAAVVAGKAPSVSAVIRRKRFRITANKAHELVTLFGPQIVGMSHADVDRLLVALDFHPVYRQY